MTWGICTDSAAYLPDEIATRYEIERVATHVVLDGVAWPEPDITTDNVFVAQAAGVAVGTAAAAPGEFAAAYARLAARGASAVLSVHIDERTSATCQSARLAARDAPVPVEVVSSGTASFALAFAVWEAAAARDAGASLPEARHVVLRVAAASGSTFCVQGVEMARRGGRLRVEPGDTPLDAVPILALVEGSLRPVGSARSIPDAVELMAGHVLAGGADLRVGVGHARAGAIADALAGSLGRAEGVREIFRYDVGPVVAVHTGPGVAGAVFYPAGVGVR